MGTGSSVDKRVLVEYNVDLVHDALLAMFTNDPNAGRVATPSGMIEAERS